MVVTSPRSSFEALASDAEGRVGASRQPHQPSGWPHQCETPLAMVGGGSLWSTADRGEKRRRLLGVDRVRCSRQQRDGIDSPALSAIPGGSAARAQSKGILGMRLPTRPSPAPSFPQHGLEVATEAREIGRPGRDGREYLLEGPTHEDCLPGEVDADSVNPELV